MKYYWTRYLASYPNVLLYMLQDTDYRLDRYLTWYHRTDDFRYVMKRRSLDLTQKIRLLRIVLWTMWALILVTASLCVFASVVFADYQWGIGAIVLLALMPFILAYAIMIVLVMGRVLVQRPKERSIVTAAHAIFARSTAVHIGIAGSFGKTTMKEILFTVLAQSKNVAMTPGNMNTALGISRFAHTLNGKEDILIIELGEERVGDVKALAELSRPTTGILTGINEAHLISFKTLDRTVQTVFELVEFLGPDAQVFKNGESQLLRNHADEDDPLLFTRRGVDGWRTEHATTSIHGTHFTATRGKTIIHAKTGLLGLHTVGMTVTAIAIAHELGLSKTQIEAGLAKIIPYEHRMQPRQLHGAWVIDDTYNGNSQGVQAGLELLKDLTAKRRVYVTPGLVEQGSHTQDVHQVIGLQAAQSADVVVLMRNSVTDFIVKGLEDGRFKGELKIIDDPLEFYTNLEHFVAKGDIVLMQNDWTDNYA